MRKFINVGTPIVVLLILIVLGVYYFHHKQLFPSTDDAYVYAHTVNIAARVDGKVDKVYVKQNQYVKKGTLLFTLDPTSFQLAIDKAQAEVANSKNQTQAAQMAVNSAKARLRQAQAQLQNTMLETKRIMTLLTKGYVSKADGDNAYKDELVAKASVAAAASALAQARSQRGEVGANNADLKLAQASLATAKLNLSYTRITAPSAGYVTHFDLCRGAVVNAYQPIFALIENKTWWVSANFKETDLTRIRVGQPVQINLDMYPDHIFYGQVTSLSPSSSSSFSLLPAENTSANWVKVTQRFPIRIMIQHPNNPKFPLRIGASATVKINTQQQSPATPANNKAMRVSKGGEAQLSYFGQ